MSVIPVLKGQRITLRSNSLLLALGHERSSTPQASSKTLYQLSNIFNPLFLFTYCTGILCIWDYPYTPDSFFFALQTLYYRHVSICLAPILVLPVSCLDYSNIISYNITIEICWMNIFQFFKIRQNWVMFFPGSRILWNLAKKQDKN